MVGPFGFGRSLSVALAATASVAALLASCAPAPDPVDPVPPGPPTIEAFSVRGSRESAPVVATFRWRIGDPDGDRLTCRVDIEEGAEQTGGVLGDDSDSSPLGHPERFQTGRERASTTRDVSVGQLLERRGRLVGLIDDPDPVPVDRFGAVQVVPDGERYLHLSPLWPLTGPVSLSSAAAARKVGAAPVLGSGAERGADWRRELGRTA